MAPFDPYYKWLGIPPHEQPADHYRLLGVVRFESDLDVIESAADRQMTFVQKMATGPHSGLSQKLLNELSAARICLLNTETKASYDRKLRAAISAEETPPPGRMSGIAERFQTLTSRWRSVGGDRAGKPDAKPMDVPRLSLRLAVGLVIGCLCISVGFLAVRWEADERPVTDGNNRQSLSMPVESGGVSTAVVTLTDPITVGPSGQFKSISAALEALKARFAKPDAQGATPPPIEVAPGQVFKERLTLDNSDYQYPDGIQIIVKGDGMSTLAPGGKEPVVSLISMSQFKLEGFEIKADGASAGIVLSKFIQDTMLRRLKISGIDGSGIQSRGATGLSQSSAIILEQIDFIGGDSQAVGLRFSPSDSQTSQFDIRHCGFSGPMSAGIVVEEDVRDIHIRECVYSECGVGIRVAGSDRQLQRLRITNNTFHKVKHGVVFTEQPAPASSGVSLDRNQFVDVADEEVFVAKNYDAGRFELLLAGGMNGISPNSAPGAAPVKPPDPRPLPSAGEPGLFDFASRARGAEEADAAQQAWAKHLGVKPVETNSIGMKLVLLPPGKFRMGSPASDENARTNEQPQVEVTLTQPLYVGQTEVTQGQWKAVMGAEPWKGQSRLKEGSDCAASYVSHEDATEFSRRLSAKEGKTYRLLTEAEWEYACRAGTTTKYYFGDSAEQLSSYGWWGGFRGSGNATTAKYAHEVGQKRANPFGLYDMHGNVYEWCQDWYGEKLPGGENPAGPESGSLRVYRGGSWYNSSWNCRSAYRGRHSPVYRSFNLGFRVAVVPSRSLLASGKNGMSPNSSSGAAPVKSPDPRPLPSAGEPGLFDFASRARSAEEANTAQQAWAKHLGVKPVETNSLGMNLVLLPPGKFRMGSPDIDSEADDDEKPQVAVTLTEPLYVGQTEVTQGQWKAVMKTEPWKGQSFVKDGADCAASYVSHDDATEFCRRLSAKERKTYRLLTEAEWEYACRAGTTTKFHFGDSDDSLGEYAWFGDNAYDVDAKYAHEVGKKHANPFGLFDMYGNVWEWCSDWYGDKLPGGENPAGPESGSARVRRGGCWDNTAGLCRSAFRFRGMPAYRRFNGLGFRVAQIPSGP